MGEDEKLQLGCELPRGLKPRGSSLLFPEKYTSFAQTIFRLLLFTNAMRTLLTNILLLISFFVSAPIKPGVEVKNVALLIKHS